MDKQQLGRLQAKTPEQRYLSILEDDFDQPPRVAQVLLEEAKKCLLGTGSELRPGQIRVILTVREAGHGQALRKTKKSEVTLTLDAGQEDRQVQQEHGIIALRRVRIQRLLDEALGQGTVATQEDLAQILQVSVRTIKRDCHSLEEEGIYLPTRGKLKGIGRGQTHKAQIVGRWIRGETYDQIRRNTRHSVIAIQRYVQTFVRMIDLHQQGYSEDQIALLLERGVALVREYLAIYKQHDTPQYRDRLTEQLERLSKGSRVKKGAQ